MPSAGYSHFYSLADLRACLEPYGVSMPSAGYSHFYQSTFQAAKSKSEVSMPSAGYSHFYIPKIIKIKKEDKSSVNALGGLFSFLQ